MIKKKSVRKSVKKRTAKKATTKAATKARSKASARPSTSAVAASKRIDGRIRELGGWRAKTLANVRRLIKRADPAIVEEWKWETPVWSHDGIICTGEAYTSVVKLTFARGSALRDPSGLFNSSLGGNVRRAIDIHEDDEIDEAALRDLIQAAVALNLERSPRGKR